MYVCEDISVCRRRVCMCVMTLNFKFSGKYCCVQLITMTESTLNYHCH